MSSANAFNLDQSIILSFEEELIFNMVNPSPDMPILGFSNSAANKDMM